MSQTIHVTPDSLPDVHKLKAEMGVTELSLSEYIQQRGNFQLAVAFSKLFDPDFVEVDDLVLLAERCDPDSLATWRETLKNNRQQIEAMVNHVHVYDLFADDTDLPDEVYAYLGATIAKFWRFALAERFPQRRFKVVCSDEPTDYGPTITFYQIRSDSA